MSVRCMDELRIGAIDRDTPTLRPAPSTSKGPIDVAGESDETWPC
jgi:hypothetical protein